ncbi:hypothetical protein [Fusibacter ferrireducens]|uniref:ABC transporter permease n=1 Tax=Fusibacter ferrireducens TaxID=2785058 RepID=A0ABR9ZZW8_9FIRM|nr:hypothetical protein [Fusibacter ferrireducens]MBF4695995.1 hypothetical protein [Fusibacter ferrireducens]
MTLFFSLLLIIQVCLLGYTNYLGIGEYETFEYTLQTLHVLQYLLIGGTFSYLITQHNKISKKINIILVVPLLFFAMFPQIYKNWNIMSKLTPFISAKVIHLISVSKVTMVSWLLLGGLAYLSLSTLIKNRLKK